MIRHEVGDRLQLGGQVGSPPGLDGSQKRFFEEVVTKINIRSLAVKKPMYLLSMVRKNTLLLLYMERHVVVSFSKKTPLVVGEEITNQR